MLTLTTSLLDLLTSLRTPSGGLHSPFFLLRIEDDLTCTLSPLVATPVLLFLLQDLDVPKDPGTWVAIFVGENRTFGWVLAGRILIIRLR
jgi:hypothetical protein